MPDCCASKNNPGKESKGLFRGILSGLIPHSFCILFLVFSVIGATGASAFAKNFLVIPHFFLFLVILSIIFATLSAYLYLKKHQCLCLSGIKNKKKYLLSLYGSTIIINIIVIFGLFPLAANVNAKNSVITNNTAIAVMSLKVNIPCSGHAPLIIDELKKANGVSNVSYRLPNLFSIQYDPNLITPEKISSLTIFETFPATII